jgi:hypothetical protein
MINLPGAEGIILKPYLEHNNINQYGVSTVLHDFQTRCVNAMSLMEDPDSGIGSRAFANANHVTLPWFPRDMSLGHIHVNPLTLQFNFSPVAPTSTTGGGILSLESGLGKTLVVIAYTVLDRLAARAKFAATQHTYFSVGTVIVAPEHLVQHWTDEIRFHAPCTSQGYASTHLVRPKPKDYVDFVVTTMEKLKALPPFKMNRLCFDEAPDIPLSRGTAPFRACTTVLGNVRILPACVSLFVFFLHVRILPACVSLFVFFLHVRILPACSYSSWMCLLVRILPECVSLFVFFLNVSPCSYSS